MKKAAVFLLGMMALGMVGAGCDSNIDPDTLVRELRVLAMRFGDASPGSVSELQATVSLQGGMPDLSFTASSIRMAVLAATPTGPGRRITTPGPRPLQYDWFACVGPLSLFTPGTIDPKCLKFAPGDPPPRSNPSLIPLVAPNLAPSDGTLTVNTADLKDILGRFLSALLSSPNNGGGSTMMLPSRPMTLLLPVLVTVSVPPPAGEPSNILDSEVAYSFLRIVIALPGMTLPQPNHNPLLPLEGGVQVSSTEMGPMTRLHPCTDPRGGDCDRFSISRTAPIFVMGAAAPGSVETYTPLDESGRMNISEIMRYAWFSTDGTFDEARTGDAHPQTKWQNDGKYAAPSEVLTVELWIVVQDDRGGADYQRFQLSF